MADRPRAQPRSEVIDALTVREPISPSRLPSSGTEPKRSRKQRKRAERIERRERKREKAELRRVAIEDEIDARTSEWLASANEAAVKAAQPVALKLLTGEAWEPRAPELAPVRIARHDVRAPHRGAQLPRTRRARMWHRLRSIVRRDKAIDPRYSPQILQALPRRASLLAPHTDTSAPTMMRKVEFKVSTWSALVRILVWEVALIRFLAGNALDWLLRRASRQRSAARLRRAFEQMGGTVIKIGQQMGMRIDLLPYEYTNELSNMLDKVPPYDTKFAFEAILRTMKAKDPTVDWRIEDIFESFDPVPIGSASVSCVYQAVLRTGERVAVKVRRPNIGPVFVSDCRALSWMLRMLEVTTIMKPGLSKNLITEFRNMLLDELDFVKEARNCELFGRRLKKGKLHYADVPKVYFEYSSDEVLICEFVRGIWLTELLSAVEHKDAKILALLDELNIKPRLVAKRMLQINQFGMFENLLFHADPHPGNIVVRPNSEVVFIDFGACGSYTHKERYVWRQLMMAQGNEDISQMVQCALAVLEPLPPIDLDEFQKKLENVFWQDLYAFKSKHSEWWERTSARIWLSFLELSREFNIPMNLNTLRMIRSTLLYDTIAARLYGRISSYKEHRRYNEKAGRRARKRFHRRVHRLALRGPRPSFYLRVEQLTDMTQRIIYHAQRFLDAPPFHFAAEIGKSVYAALTVIRMVGLVIGGGVMLSFFYLLQHITFNKEENYTVTMAFYDMMGNRYMLVYSIIVVILHVRRLGFRLNDKETK